VENPGIPGDDAGDSGQSSARGLGVVASVARSRIVTAIPGLRQLVRARSEIRAGMMCSLSGGLASMGAAAVRDRRQVRAFRSAGHAPGRRRRDAMNNMRLITGHEITGAMGVAALDLLRVQQSGPQSGHVWEQRVMEGDPKFAASQDIPNVPYIGSPK